MAKLTKRTSAIHTSWLECSLSSGILGCGYHLHGFGDFLNVLDGLESEGD